MSKHWAPEDERKGWTPAKGSVRPKKQWPEGATAGLVLLATGCVALGVLLYQVAGPRDVFAP